MTSGGKLMWSWRNLCLWWKRLKKSNFRARSHRWCYETKRQHKCQNCEYQEPPVGLHVSRFHTRFSGSLEIGLQFQTWAVFWIAPQRNFLDCTNKTVCTCVSALHELSNLYKCEVGACRVCCIAQIEPSWNIRTKNGGSKRSSKMRHPRGTHRMAQTIEIICEVWLDLHSKMESMLNALMRLSWTDLATVSHDDVRESGDHGSL